MPLHPLLFGVCSYFLWKHDTQFADRESVQNAVQRAADLVLNLDTVATELVTRVLAGALAAKGRAVVRDCARQTVDRCVHYGALSVGVATVAPFLNLRALAGLLPMHPPTHRFEVELHKSATAVSEAGKKLHHTTVEVREAGASRNSEAVGRALNQYDVAAQFGAHTPMLLRVLAQRHAEALVELRRVRERQEVAAVTLQARFRGALMRQVVANYRTQVYTWLREVNVAVYREFDGNPVGYGLTPQETKVYALYLTNKVARARAGAAGKGRAARAAAALKLEGERAPSPGSAATAVGRIQRRWRGHTGRRRARRALGVQQGVYDELVKRVDEAPSDTGRAEAWKALSKKEKAL